MKTKEFIKRVEGLGFTVEEGVYDNWVIMKDKEVVAVVSKKEIFAFDTYTPAFKEMTNNLKEELTLIIYTYSKTPISDRDGGDRMIYYLRLKNDIIPAKRNYLNYDDYSKEMYISDSSFPFKTTFTKEEIIKLDEKHNILNDFYMEEIKDA